MKTLAIDTSTYTMGIAVSDGNTILGEYMTNLKKNHSIRVMPAIQALLEEVEIKPAELDRIVAAEGPGSFTGVRIGVTIAKTLAWTLNIPLVGVSSLEMLAQNGKYFNGFVCPLFDARRGQVYTGLYGRDKDEFLQTEKEQNILMKTWTEQLKKLDKEILFVGNDVEIHKTVIENELGDQAVIAKMSDNNPRPSELVRLGIDREPRETHSFVPNYLRLAEAEAKWIESKKN